MIIEINRSVVLTREMWAEEFRQPPTLHEVKAFVNFVLFILRSCALYGLVTNQGLHPTVALLLSLE